MSLSEAVYTANKLYKVVIMLLKRVYIYIYKQAMPINMQLSTTESYLIFYF